MSEEHSGEPGRHFYDGPTAKGSVEGYVHSPLVIIFYLSCNL